MRLFSHFAFILQGPVEFSLACAPPCAATAEVYFPLSSAPPPPHWRRSSFILSSPIFLLIAVFTSFTKMYRLKQGTIAPRPWFAQQYATRRNAVILQFSHSALCFVVFRFLQNAYYMRTKECMRDVQTSLFYPFTFIQLQVAKMLLSVPTWGTPNWGMKWF